MKSKAFSVLLAVVFVVFLFLCVTTPAQSQDKVIRLKYSNHHPPDYGISKLDEEWGKEIDKRSNGRVKITFYHGGTLTSSSKVYEGVVKGLSDIGTSIFMYTPGRFPLMDVVDLPGYTIFNSSVTTHVADDLYRKFQPKELADTHVLYLRSPTPSIYFTVNKPIRKLEDWKGVRIRCAGVTTRIVELLGGTPVGMPKAEEYDAMTRGIVDGTGGAPCSLEGWRIADITKYSVWVAKAGYGATTFVTMNKRKWESLPQDVQKIFTDVSKEYLDKTGDRWNQMDLDGVEYGKKLGHQLIFPDEKEAARWEQALKPIFAEYVKAMESKGLPGKAALEYRQQLIEKYSKIYPPVKFQ